MYITVLNFEDGRVYQHHKVSFSLSEELTSEDYEAYLDRKGYKLNSIEWMIHKDGEIIKR